MRLWSIHPGYLDAKGLVALWREGLLAQKVLLGNTQGYRHHPQLVRFKRVNNPVGAIASYLRHVADEADRRGYHFDRSKIVNKRIRSRMPVTSGQLEYEFKHLLGKIKKRDRALYEQFRMVGKIRLHPIFRQVTGAVEDWEIV